MLELTVVLVIGLVIAFAVSRRKRTPIVSDDRTRARMATLNAFLDSSTWQRIADIQLELATITNPTELAGLHDAIDLSEEQSPLSPTTELAYLLKAELLFVQLKTGDAKHHVASGALAELEEYARLRRDQTEDPTFWLELQILQGMAALQRGEKGEAEARLGEFEAITQRFGMPADASYVAEMRRHIATGDLAAARETFTERLAAFFPMHFQEVRESFRGKLALMGRMGSG